MPEPTLPILLTPADLVRLGIVPSVNTLYKRRTEGKPTPRATRIGKHLRFTEQAVADFIAEQTEPEA